MNIYVGPQRKQRRSPLERSEILRDENSGIFKPSLTALSRPLSEAHRLTGSSPEPPFGFRRGCKSHLRKLPLDPVRSIACGNEHPRCHPRRRVRLHPARSKPATVPLKAWVSKHHGFRGPSYAKVTCCPRNRQQARRGFHQLMRVDWEDDGSGESRGESSEVYRFCHPSEPE